MVPAARNSAGTLEPKPRSLTAEYYRELFTRPGGVLDAIKEKMHFRRHIPIIIQHDGASPHTGHDNEALIALAGSTGGWTFAFKRQPAQSPDLNILDLGFFHSLKSRVSHLRNRANNITQLVVNVQICYDAYDKDTLNNIWAHLYACWRSILEVNGSNQYEKPHDDSRNRANHGGFSVDLRIPMVEYNRVVELLNNT